jgi:hypothetical protein
LPWDLARFYPLRQQRRAMDFQSFRPMLGTRQTHQLEGLEIMSTGTSCKRLKNL